MASGSPTINKIERSHQMYRDGKYVEALDYYTDALSTAKNKPQKIALHSNRAACYLKLHDFKKAAKECSSVLELDHNHTGALMLRAQTLVTLKEYQSAIFDVNRLIDLNPSSEVYKNLQARLKTQLSLAPIPEDEAELEDEDCCTHKTELTKTEEEQKSNNKIEECERVVNYVIAEAVENKKSDYINHISNATVENMKKNESAFLSVPDAGAAQDYSNKRLSGKETAGWQTIPKPKGHSNLDYSRWDRVEDDSSDEEDEDDDDNEDSQPQYRFRVKTVGVKAVK